MVVLVANHLPPAVRGKIKLWFVEPKPNVFVSGVVDHVAQNIIRYLAAHCPAESGLVVFTKTRRAPGYEIFTLGDSSRKVVEISGLQLIVDGVVSGTSSSESEAQS